MRLQHGFGLAALILFLISLTQPVFISESFPTQDGLNLLQQGAGLWRNGVYAWYANPLLLVAVVIGWAGWLRCSLVIGFVAMILALTTFLAVPTLESAGTSVPEFQFGPGFYLWLAAFASALAGPAVGLAGQFHAAGRPGA